MSATKCRIFVSAGMLLFTAAAGSAQQQAKTAVKPPVKKQTVATAGKQTPGLVIAKDPVTGELRAPTAAEMAELSAGQSGATVNSKQPGQKSAAAAPVVEHHADGSMSMALGEDTVVYSVMTKGPDGKLRMECVQGKTEADKAALGGMTAKKAAKEVANDK